MSGFYIVALVMRKDTAGSTAIKPTLSWRWGESEEAAVGGAMKWAQEEMPEWAIASHIVTEIPASQITAAAAKVATPTAETVKGTGHAN